MIKVTLKSIVFVSLLSLFGKTSVLETRQYDILKLAKSAKLGLTPHGSSSRLPAVSVSERWSLDSNRSGGRGECVVSPWRKDWEKRGLLERVR